MLASLAILGEDVSDVAPRLEAPLEPAQFWQELERELEQERQRKGLGILTQPIHVQKVLLAAAIGLQSGKTNFIETGTYTGQSLFKIVRLFDHLVTVEADPRLHKAAIALFQSWDIGNVDAHCSDSLSVLRTIDSDFGNNGVFFLDAHYSGGPTSKRYGACPVIEEIRILLERCPDAVVVVDDMRVMNGKQGYPTLSEILSQLPSAMSVQIMLDQLVFRGTQGVDIPRFEAIAS